MKRKSAIAAVAAAALALSLAACGSADSAAASSAAPAGDFDTDQDITVISREDGSGTRGAFIELTGVEEKNADGKKVDNTTEAAAIQSSTNGVMTAVANDETAIGYISLGSLNDSVKAYAEKKVGKLEKFFKEEPEASVTFSVEKKNRCVAEITLRGANGTLFRAVCEDPDGDMRGAIDEATAQIERKIRKNKTRLAKNLRAEAVLPELPEEFEAHEEGTFDIVRTKRFTVKPMSVEEAILQMNLLGHSFFVFRNTDFADAICVVYRRNNGGYGLIETEDDEE